MAAAAAADAGADPDAQAKYRAAPLWAPEWRLMNSDQAALAKRDSPERRKSASARLRANNNNNHYYDRYHIDA